MRGPTAVYGASGVEDDKRNRADVGSETRHPERRERASWTAKACPGPDFMRSKKLGGQATERRFRAVLLARSRLANFCRLRQKQGCPQVNGHVDAARR